MQSTNFKKILIIIVFLGIVGFLLVWGYAHLQQRRDAGVAPSERTLFPFGAILQTERPPAEDPIIELDPEPEPVVVIPGTAPLRQITTFPVTDFVALAGGVVRYNEKETGYIYESTIGQDTITQKQLTNTLVPGAQEAVFAPSGNHVILRFYDTERQAIQSFAGEIPGVAEPLSCKNDFTATASVGDRGDDVRELQQALGLLLGRSVDVDGAFGPGTEELVQDFQRLYELEETGAFDDETRLVLNRECRLLEEASRQEVAEPVELVGSFLAEHISNLTVSSDDTLFGLIDAGDRMVGTTVDFDGSNQQQIFDSPFTEWLGQWTGVGNEILLTTKASGVAPGFAYILDTGSRTIEERVLGDITGLTTKASPFSDAILYTEIDEMGELQLHLYENGRTDTFGLETFAEKCSFEVRDIIHCGVPVTVPQGLYPDAWYQGVTSFSDTIWEINLSTQETSLIALPSEYGVGIDLVSPQHRGGYFYFVNKKDGTLWVFDTAGTERGPGSSFGEETTNFESEPGPIIGNNNRCPYFTERVRLGTDNDPYEVNLIKHFLATYRGEDLERMGNYNGTYNIATHNAVVRFQRDYSNQILWPWLFPNVTWWYKTTPATGNWLMGCTEQPPIYLEDGVTPLPPGDGYLYEYDYSSSCVVRGGYEDERRVFQIFADRKPYCDELEDLCDTYPHCEKPVDFTQTEAILSTDN